MRRSRITATIAALVLTAIAMSAVLAGAPKTILVKIDQAPLPWTESKFEEKFVADLSRNPNLRIRPVGDQSGLAPEFPSAVHDSDSLLDWGAEVGGRYLLYISIDSERMERKKTFSLPLVFHRYEVVGIIEGELRLLDISNRRLVAAEPFKVSVKGPRQFQGEMDDDRYDAGLHIPAPQRTAFFARLEDKLIEKLGQKVRHYTRGR